MTTRARVTVAAVAILTLVLVRPALGESELVGLFLTWQRDPTTTMTIDWHILDEEEEQEEDEQENAEDDENGEPENNGNSAAGGNDANANANDEADDRPAPMLEYREDGEDEWQTAEGDSRPFPFSDRTIHRVELTDLEPGTLYEFRLADDEDLYRFRTMPADARRPIRFATGGDVRHRKELMERTNRAAMEYDPDFIVWGGDLAYADGREDRVDRWHEWFDANLNTLIDEEGRVVPVLPAIGNHEVRGGYHHSHDDYEQTDEWRERIAPYYYVLFAFPGQPGYAAMDFGEYLSIILLDTRHSNPIEGEQTQWLDEALAERRDVPHVFPTYHVPGYPSHRSYGGGTERRVREHFVPLFEEHGVRAAFENHDHTYKRTHPLRGGEIYPGGVVYIGDGAWGVSTRSGESFDECYIARAASERHFILVTVHGTHQHFLMINEDGDVIDEYPETP